jgi:hypothetical protein
VYKQTGRYETTVPREDVWAVYTSVPSWPEWSEDIERAHLDGGSFATGSHGRIKFKQVPESRFDIVAVEAPESYVIVAQLFWGLLKVTFDHELTSITAGTQIMESADFSGPLAPLLGLIERPRVRRQWPKAMRAMTALAAQRRGL